MGGGGRSWRLALLVAGVALAGCGPLSQAFRGAPQPASNPDRVGPAIPIGGGGIGTDAWGAWIWRARDGSACLEIESGDGSGGFSCGPANDATGVGLSQSGNSAFVSGGTLQPTASEAVVHMADGSEVRLAVVLPPVGVTAGVRYYVGPVPLDGRPASIDIVDGSGAVLETFNLSGF